MDSYYTNNVWSDLYRMLETFIRLNSSRTGHDKLLRTVQYSCRLILASGNKTPQISQLVATISFSRKFLRLGTFIDALYSSCSSISNPQPGLRVLVTLSRIAGAMYLFCDHLLWCNNMRLVSINQKFWTNTSERCWLYSIVLSLCRDIYEINLILRHSAFQLQNGTNFATFLIKNHPKIILDTVKNMTDLILPIAALGNYFYFLEFVINLYIQVT